MAVRRRGSALVAEQSQVEHEWQALRLKMAEVEQELGELTPQQALLQKVQVAIDQLLSYLDSPGSHTSSLHEAENQGV